jgi:hypothetical protein
LASNKGGTKEKAGGSSFYSRDSHPAILAQRKIADCWAVSSTFFSASQSSMFSSGNIPTLEAANRRTATTAVLCQLKPDARRSKML